MALSIDTDGAIAAGTCASCGSTDLREMFEGGDVICTACGVRAATASQRSVTNDWNGSQVVTTRGRYGTVRSVMREPKQAKGSSKGRDGPSAAALGAGKVAAVRAIDGLLAFQWLIKAQAEWIVRVHGVNAALVAAAREIWLKFVNVHASSLNSWFGGPAARATAPAKLSAAAATASFSLAHSLAILYLAARWLKSALIPFDLARWCCGGEMPYLSALHRLPASHRARVAGAHHLFNEASRSIPDALHITVLAHGVARAVGFPRRVTLTAWPVAARLADATDAPRAVGRDALHRALRPIVRVALEGAQLRLHRSDVRGAPLLQPSLVLMAAVVVACKAMPGSNAALCSAARRGGGGSTAYPRPHDKAAVPIQSAGQALALATRIAADRSAAQPGLRPHKRHRAYDAHAKQSVKGGFAAMLSVLEENHDSAKFETLRTIASLIREGGAGSGGGGRGRGSVQSDENSSGSSDSDSDSDSSGSSGSSDSSDSSSRDGDDDAGGAATLGASYWRKRRRPAHKIGYEREAGHSALIEQCAAAIDCAPSELHRAVLYLELECEAAAKELDRQRAKVVAC